MSYFRLPFFICMAGWVSLVACDNDSSPTVCPTPAPTVAPTPVSTPTPIPTPTPPLPNRGPEGAFHFRPAPDAHHVIYVVAREEELWVNGAHFSDPDGDPLSLSVDWGDGNVSSARCGPCRVHHIYHPGTHHLRAEITDGTHTVVDKETVIAGN